VADVLVQQASQPQALSALPELLALCLLRNKHIFLMQSLQ
jgi:hypothetical protein